MKKKNLKWLHTVVLFKSRVHKLILKEVIDTLDVRLTFCTHFRLEVRLAATVKISD